MVATAQRLVDSYCALMQSVFDIWVLWVLLSLDAFKERAAIIFKKRVADKNFNSDMVKRSLSNNHDCTIA
jgi:hypothetical protein